jgi:hypothetical protein
MIEKVCKNILKICLTIEAFLIIIGLLANYEIKIPLVCFFGLFALDRIIEIWEYNDG